MIKINLPLKHFKNLSSESVWALRFGKNIAQICNIPFLAAKFKYGDLVEFDPESFKVLRIIEDGGPAKFYGGKKI